MGFLQDKHNLTILHTRPGSCDMCGVVHDKAYPHDLHSLAYQYMFYDRNGRWPTWEDAIAHCSDNIKEIWTQVFKSMGGQLGQEKSPLREQ